MAFSRLENLITATMISLNLLGCGAMLWGATRPEEYNPNNNRISSTSDIVYSAGGFILAQTSVLALQANLANHTRRYYSSIP